MSVLETASIPAASYGQDPEMLAAQLRSGKQHSVDAVAQSFEGMFMSLLMKEMRQTLDSGSFFGGDSADVYGGMFDMYLGQHLAQAGGIGLAKVLKSQLQRAKS
jgi:peptidoglycan hydrolase FlgJ